MLQRALPLFQALILFLVGSVFVWFYAHGRINAYLTKAGSFQIQALLAGVVLCIIAVFLAHHQNLERI